MLSFLSKYSWLAVSAVFSVSFGYFLTSGNVWITASLATFLTSGIGIYLLGFKKKLLFYLVCFSIPLSIGLELPGTGTVISTPSEILQLLLFAIVVLHFILKSTKKSVLTHPLTILLFLDLVWLFIASLLGTMPEVSLKRLLMKLNYFTIFYLLFTHLEKEGSYKEIKPFFYYALGLIPVTLFILYKHVQTGFDQNYVFEISKPFYAEHTVYGACLAFITPIMFSILFQSRKLNLTTGATTLLIMSAILILVSQFLALSRAAFLSLAFVLLFFILIRLRATFSFLISILLIVIGSAWFFQNNLIEYAMQTEAVSNDGNIANHVQSVSNVSTDASNLERINRWVCAIEMFNHKPITGFGPGTYQFEYAQFQSPEYMTVISTRHGDKGNAHSEYLMYLSETGIVGFLIFLSIVLYSTYLGVSLWNSELSSVEKNIGLGVLLGLLTFFFHGIFNAFSDQDEMAFLYFIALGTIALLDIERKKKMNAHIHSKTH